MRSIHKCGSDGHESLAEGKWIERKVNEPIENLYLIDDTEMIEAWS